MFLIMTAEKTATERKMKERGLKIEKNQTLAEKIFLVFVAYFSNYHSVVCKWLCTCVCLVCVCVCVCVCLCVCVCAFCIIQAALE